MDFPYRGHVIEATTPQVDGGWVPRTVVWQGELAGRHVAWVGPSGVIRFEAAAEARAMALELGKAWVDGHSDFAPITYSFPYGRNAIVASGQLFLVAVAARDRVRVSGARDDSQALVAVLFSAFALEAFTNELAVAFALDLRFEYYENKIQRPVTFFRMMAEEFDRTRLPTLAKLDLAFLAFTGKRYDKGAEPFQDLRLLFQLRDAIVHRAPEEVQMRTDEAGSVSWTTSPHSLVARLRAKDILAVSKRVDSSEIADDAPLTWLVNTIAAAEWACTTTQQVVRSLLDVLPGGPNVWGGFQHVRRTLFKLNDD